MTHRVLVLMACLVFRTALTQASDGLNLLQVAGPTEDVIAKAVAEIKAAAKVDPAFLAADKATLAAEKAQAAEKEAVVVDQVEDAKEKYKTQQRMTPENTFRLYESVHVTTALLSKHGIKHFAYAGTLLGAMRNNGLILHDDDADFVMLHADLSKLETKAFHDDLAKYGLEYVAKYPGLYSIVNASFNSKCYDDCPYFVDLFTVIEDGHRIVYMLETRRGDKGKTFPLDIFDHTELHTFGQTAIPVPKHSLALQALENLYGSNWNSSVNCQGTAHKCEVGNDQEWSLRHHAMPDGPFVPIKW
jgi:hypothetical protein